MIKLQTTVAALLIRVASGDFNPDAPRAALVEAELQHFLQDLEDKQFPMPADVPDDVAESLVEEDADFSAEVMDVQASFVNALLALTSSPNFYREKPFVRALAAALDVDESAIESGVLAAFRRLYFESHTLTLGDLRARMERRDDDQPRKLPMAERAERLAQLKAQLTGVTIDVQLEPAHRLVDAVNQQIEDNCVKYVPIKDCLSRESELMHQKHETAIDFLPDGTMKLSKKQKEIHADTTGELKVKMAMQRRALAYHMAGRPLEDELQKLQDSPEADAARVKAANRLYEVALLCIFIAVVRGMNAAFAATNKLVLLDVDALAAMILCAMKAVQCDTKTRVTLGNGDHVFLQESQDWGKSLNLLGRTLDLESAYKQVGAFVDELWNRIIVVFDPHRAKPAFFVATALMFGSSASVYAFNRISRFLWHIQMAMFNIWSTNFYDDYPTVEPGEVATSSLEASSLLLDCLGWKFAKEGKKALPFAEVFSVLGVQLRLGNSSKGEIWMQNKPDRVASISATVERLHDRGKIHAGEAASLHGQVKLRTKGGGTTTKRFSESSESL
eukprot:symbB.v1.2.040360.t1/scaffold7170.1/size12902/1